MALKSGMAWFLIVLHVVLWALWHFKRCSEDEEAGSVGGGEGASDDPAADGGGGGDDLRRAGEEDEYCWDAREWFSKYPITGSELGVVTSFLTFFVVFYNGNCFARYNQLYDKGNVITGRIHNISLWLRAYYVNPMTRWNVLRYILASHVLHFWSTKKRAWDWAGKPENSDDEKNPGSCKDFCDEFLVKKGLLVQEEADVIVTYKGNKHKLLFSWSIISLKKIMQVPLPDGEFQNPYLMSELEQTALLDNVKEELVQIRGAIGGMDHIMLFPMPFFYFHMVQVTMLIHHVLLAYAFLFANGKAGTHFSLVVYPVIVFIFAGLVEVGKGMADPFGDQDYDFNITAMTNNMYNECKTLSELPEEPFFGKLGDPKFNPKRNPDGTLVEVTGAAPDDDDFDDDDDGPMFPNSAVRGLQDEAAELKKTLSHGMGAVALANTVRRLAEVNEHIMERLDALHFIPETLEASKQHLFQRVDEVEKKLLDKAKLVTDPHHGEEPESTASPVGSVTATSTRGRRRSLVQIHEEAEKVRKKGRRLSSEQQHDSVAREAGAPFGAALKRDEQGQIEIAFVAEGSAADKGGLCKGDLVLSVDGIGFKLWDVATLTEWCEKKYAADTFCFVIRRDGEQYIIWVPRVAEENPNEFSVETALYA